MPDSKSSSMSIHENGLKQGSSLASSGTINPTHASQNKPKLLDQLRGALRSRHYSRSTESTYVHWVKRYIYFHNVRHPKEMAEPEINAFLTSLAVKEHVSASTQNQALCAILFLYRYVLDKKIGDLGEVIRARKPLKLPVVMTKSEVKSVLGNLSGEVDHGLPYVRGRIEIDGMSSAESSGRRF